MQPIRLIPTNRSTIAAPHEQEVRGNARARDETFTFGIRELVQSGMVAINRGSRSITDRTLKPAPPISTRNPA